MALINPSAHSSASQKPPIPMKRWLSMGVIYLILVIMTFLSLYPLALMIINAFKDNTDVLTNASGLPHPWTLDSFVQMVDMGLLGNFLNSLIISTVTTVVSVFLACLAAYAFTKLKFPGRNVIFFILLATLMVPLEITIPPLYLMFAQLNWIDTLQVQIVPFIAPVFGLFMMRQYLLSVPDSFLEAARLDGANEWQIFSRIIIPITMPILSSFAILQFLSTWNSYLWPQVMANSTDVAPLGAILPTITDPVLGLTPIYGTIMAGSVLATLPLVLVFLRFQNQFMSGATFGAAKE